LSVLDPNRPVGEEARKAHPTRVSNGFIATYLSGQAILDIGYKGYRDDVVPIVPTAIGVDLDYPGYDGVTLPFPEGSQDAVFASHCLEHIEDFQNAIRDWFRVLKHGGYLLIMVPHQFLYEKQTSLPSRYNDDHKRFYTPASLMAEIEMSLRPNTYRLRHLRDNDARYDYTIPPYRHSGGSYELEAVIEKIRPPSWNLAKPSTQATSAKDTPLKPDATLRPDQIAKPREGGSQPVRVNQTGADPALLYDFGNHLPMKLRILVLKLDHLGDFIIGTPSLQRLRNAFPGAHIRLVVGAWNRAAAEASGLADEVVIYNYFPQHALGWDGKPHERVEKFRASTTGLYDIAIDLRVDEDTRWLLADVEAGLRCGIGSRVRHPFLDVVLPPEHAARKDASALNLTDTFIKPSRFDSTMPFRYAFCHETDFRPVSGHVIYGPYITLPVGHFKVIFDLQLTGWQLGLRKTNVTLDISRDGQEIGVSKRLRARDLKTLSSEGIVLSFENVDVDALYEFRVHVVGHPLQTRLRFGGVRLQHAESVASARFRRAELHIGEQLSLLVQLVLDRTQDLYHETTHPVLLRDPAPATRHIAIAPFSNSNLRDWPFAHYVKLIRKLLDNLDCSITLLGSQQQVAQLDRMMVEVGDSTRIRNLGGKTAWADMPGLLRQADLVICNNSGIAHLGASAGALMLAIYSASHQPQEWGPRGRRSHALMSVVPCSPCGYDRLDECPNEHRCMEGLAPETVFTQAAALLSADPAATALLEAILGKAH
jgi:ADP-heptose:LPS heptosyltransferase